MIDLTGACRRHRATLVDFLDHGELSDSAEAAFTHLQGCRRCSVDLEATALSINALHRLRALIANREPRADAWPRLRQRLESAERERRKGQSVRAASRVVVGLVGCLVASVAVLGSSTAGESPSTPIAISQEARFAAPAEEPSGRRPPRAAEAPVEIRIELARWTGPDGLGMTISPMPGSGGPASGPI